MYLSIIVNASLLMALAGSAWAAPVTSLTIQSVSSSQLSLSWPDAVGNIQNYFLYRNGALIATLPGTQSTYQDVGLSPLTSYSYTVAAMSASASGMTKALPTPTPTPTPTPAPLNSVVSSINEGSVLSGANIIWTASPSGSPSQVDFYIDGVLKWTEKFALHQFNGDPDGRLDSKTLSNGAHQLKLVALYGSGASASKVINVMVSNSAPAPSPTPTPVPNPTPSPTPQPPPPPTSGDGSDRASAGCSAQFPTLLTSYTARPSWRVAGVDYCVGLPGGLALKNPATAPLPPGVTRDLNIRVLFVNGNNVVIDGWDLSNWSVSIGGNANGTVVTNNKFYRGVLRYEPGVMNGTIKYNYFDQTGIAPNTAPFIIFGEGNYVIEHNHFKNSYHMHAQFTHGNNRIMNVFFRYNLLENAGLGAPQGAHGDFIQSFGVFHDDAIFDYNTVVQNNPQSATQGWSVQGSSVPTNVRRSSVSNNTHVITSNVNYVIILAKYWTIQSAVVRNNFTRKGEPLPYFFRWAPDWAGPYPGGALDFGGNINMLTGAPMN